MTATPLVIRTSRLDLVAATLDHAEAELGSRSALYDLLDAFVPDDWPPGEYDRGAQEFFRDRLASTGRSQVGWLTWYAISRDSTGRREALVGCAGFLGPPAGGRVEIGYSLVAGARGHGYATEIVRALLAFAFEHPDVDEVVAFTSEENAESARVLVRCGFSRIGPGREAGSVEYRTKRAAVPPNQSLQR